MWYQRFITPSLFMRIYIIRFFIIWVKLDVPRKKSTSPTVSCHKSNLSLSQTYWDLSSLFSWKVAHFHFVMYCRVVYYYCWPFNKEYITFPQEKLLSKHINVKVQVHFVPELWCQALRITLRSTMVCHIKLFGLFF